ncbi:TetR/AcrR family transcriptional regulator [Clostridium beijerinckii]|uniref:AcrR family transcriptional regulator n=3 Tax=Clostridium beijerinckii TaxID=1520 RepID=A0A0B5QPT9_CLOBE|nr:TetR/AcrR family transcriptional regulator [Clostridium beijerinckii]AJH00023.1 TetR family transcriptional regulator [Clostridium beijerinckii]AQS05820.1 putative HTH-type transcriptional regulator YttP [Clostridium beijerinckii]MBA2885451.1 AcrR family transcriptional regulator [Clostridium beijerinckii]MBA2900048.1 AcrR family transcriptional regulator [Clostridium beijerinckii]MBA2909677.1 AcrR family transcriptional regulator [Clostridium beijerinckii]
MENSTRDKIFYTSFRLFLENGYEATNIRDICKEVGVKASTIYFYYKSKQDLFFYIYDYIYKDYIDYMESIETMDKNIPIKEKLYTLLKKKIEYYVLDISKRKFILRCHMFPPEDIASAIREKYKLYIAEENKIILDIMGNPQYNDKFITKNINSYLIKCKKLEDYLLYEMITSNIRINDKVISKLWDIFFELM